MKKDADGSQIYTEMHGSRPSKYQSNIFKYNYDRNDSVFEAHRKRNNKPVIQGIIRDLRKMEVEAVNGFRGKDLPDQIKIVEKRKLSVLSALGNGDFYVTERQRIIEITDRMINRRYDPCMEPAEKAPN